MNKKITSFIIVIMLILASSKADAWIGFYLGPNCTIYPINGNRANGGKLNTGFGIQGGFLYITNTSRFASFRMDMEYTWSQTYANIHINMDAYHHPSSTLEGNVNLYGVLISPKIQFNVLSDRRAFINFGVSPRFIYTSGKGTAYHRDGSVSQSGGNDFSDFFKKFAVAANIGIGYQEIKVGSVTLFAEITESYDISTITYTAYTSPWRALTSSLTFGIRIYRNQNNSYEYN